jgi:hypothetical protein
MADMTVQGFMGTTRARWMVSVHDSGQAMEPLALGWFSLGFLDSFEQHLLGRIVGCWPETHSFRRVQCEPAALAAALEEVDHVIERSPT